MPKAKGALSQIGKYLKPTGQYLGGKGQSLVDVYKKLHQTRPFLTGVGTGAAGLGTLNVLKNILSEKNTWDTFN